MNPPTPIPPVIPIPGPFVIPQPNLLVPEAELPQWAPVPIYQEDILGIPTVNPQSNDEEEEEETEETDEENLEEDNEMPPAAALPEVTYIELPGGFEVPVPKEEIVVTAVTTAGVAAVTSVGATLLAGSMFKQIVKIAKPAIKTLLKKLAKVRGKPQPLTWSRKRLELRRCRDCKKD